MKKKLRHLWHELYYKVTPASGVDFAMSCQQASEMIDLRARPARWVDRFRLKLHLSICQACHNYLKANQFLRQAICKMVRDSEGAVDIETINRELLLKHLRKVK